MENKHISVLLEEATDFLLQNPHLNQNQKPIFLDGTLGGGGYTARLATLSNPKKIIACDLDSFALKNFWQFSGLDERKFGSVIDLVHGSFLEAVLSVEDESLSGIVADLGFSSNQLEQGGRGFSYQTDHQDELFDLRYDQDRGVPAFVKIQKLKSGKELGRIIFRYSGERLAMKIGQNLFDLCMEKKSSSESVSVKMSVESVLNSIPASLKHRQNSILSRVWQALRIWINDELDILEQFLDISFNKLHPGGRLVVVSFHSLEDKIVTSWMRRLAAPLMDRVYGHKTSAALLLTKKPVTPAQDEIDINKRSRSAMLRCLEKTL